MEVQLRCHITSPAAWAESTVYTENISRNGVLIGFNGFGAAETPPAVGQIVTIEIELPANHAFGQKCIHCQGTVTRVAQPAQRNPQFALRVNYMDFRAFHDRFRSVDLRPAAVTGTA